MADVHQIPYPGFPSDSFAVIWRTLESFWDAVLPFALLWCNLMLCATCAKYYSWRRFSSPISLRLHTPDTSSVSDVGSADFRFVDDNERFKLGYAQHASNSGFDEIWYQMEDRTAVEDLSIRPIVAASARCYDDVAPLFSSCRTAVRTEHSQQFSEEEEEITATVEEASYLELAQEAELSDSLAGNLKMMESGRGKQRSGKNEMKGVFFDSMAMGTRVSNIWELGGGGVGRMDPSREISSFRIYSHRDSRIVTLCGLPSIASCEKLSPLALNIEAGIFCVRESKASPLTGPLSQGRSFGWDALVCSSSTLRWIVERQLLLFPYNYNTSRGPRNVIQMRTGAAFTPKKQMEWASKALICGTRSATFGLATNRYTTSDISATNQNQASGFLEFNPPRKCDENNVYLHEPEDGVANSSSTGEEIRNVSLEQVVAAAITEEEEEEGCKKDDEEEEEEEEGNTKKINDYLWSGNNEFDGLYAKEFDDGGDKYTMTHGKGSFQFGIAAHGSFHSNQDDEQSCSWEIDATFQNVNTCSCSLKERGDGQTWWDDDAVFIEQEDEQTWFII